ncbi:MAG: dihydroorotate dehydrogenase [Planctomycetota bacterium]|nr:dihydroorotate dehydrogenase [Planctomycetota bacterium]MDA1105805.1 dihydroorotate dehydrogenase [Planctomycetota bacterium]
MSALRTSLAGIDLHSPLIGAAGTAGYTTELSDAGALRSLGAVTSKSLTLHPREGNELPRVIPLRAGMLNAIGLANMGIDQFIAERAGDASAMPCRLFASVAGHCVDDFVQVAARLDRETEVPLIELNVSCPNTVDGRTFTADPSALNEMVSQVRAVVTRAKLFAKLPPDGDTVALAGGAVEAGVDGLTLCNTLPAMAIDVVSRRYKLANRRGGLSGPALHAVAVRVVHDVRCQVTQGRLPIIGLGGVVAWDDAAELILAGADAVGLGTILLADPSAPRRIRQGLESWLTSQGVESIASLVGQVGS